MRQTVLILILGLLLDLIFGDPYWLYHPIRLIGLLISKLEAVFRKLFPRTEKGELAAGVCLGLSVTVISAGVPLLVLLLAARIHPGLAFGLGETPLLNFRAQLGLAPSQIIPVRLAIIFCTAKVICS